MKKIVSSIDIGTNTITILIVEIIFNKIAVLYENEYLTALGSGLIKNNLITEKALLRCIIALEMCKKNNVLFNVTKTLCVATSALRQANNSTLILNKINSIGFFPKIISGEEEAKYISTIVQYEFPDKINNTLIVDVGGGSTELIYYKNKKLEFCESVEIGAITLYEQFFINDPPNINEITNCKNFIKRKLSLSTIFTLSIDSLIGVGGTVTSLCAINYKIYPFNSKLIHKNVLSYKSLLKINRDLISKTMKERKQIVGLSSGRSKIVPAGSLILSQIMGYNKFVEMSICERGLRWGVLIKELELF